MTTPAAPTPPNLTPSDTPEGFLVALLGKYLPPGYPESLIRTWVPVGVGIVITWVLSLLAADFHWHIVISEHASATAGMVSVGVVTAAYYALARWVEKRWPKVGRIMVSLNLVKARPVYAKPNEGVRLINVDTGEVRRSDPTAGR